MAVAMTGGDVVLENTDINLLRSAMDALQSAGAQISETESGIRVVRNGSGIAPVDVTTDPFPGFPTDLQAQFMGLMTMAKGESRITETIFENRFMHVQELARLGARISLASVSLVIAGLAAEGETVVNRVYHLDRGFERLEEKLTNCGAQVERISS
jgi:UDP-N-acetylglucosamine 1-carboxyvinyltransferase